MEHQPFERWRAAALELKDPQAIITAAYALARSGAKEDQAAIAKSLTEIDLAALPIPTRLELLRAHQLVWLRLGAPNESQRLAALKQLDSQYPGTDALVNRELAATLVYLKAPQVVERTVQ